MTQVAANKRKLCLCGIHILQFTNAFNGFVLIDIAAQTVNGIGGINDNTPVHQAFCHLFDQPGLRIIRMYLYEHLYLFRYSFEQIYNYRTTY